MIFGHEQIHATLSEVLPPVALFRGPKSVGKTTLAYELAAEQGISGINLLSVPFLSADISRAITEFSARASDSDKLAVIQLDGSFYGSLNILLKSLEEVPAGMHFILISSQTLPVLTIVSRAEMYRFHFLTEEQITEVLVHKKNFNRERAEGLAHRGSGTIESALKISEYADDKALVIQALHFIHARDATSLEVLSLSWTDATTTALVRWCSESISRDWRLFSQADSEFEDIGTPLKILRLLRPDIRPRLVVRASLMSMIVGN